MKQAGRTEEQSKAWARLAVVIVLGFVLGPSLILFGVIPFEYRFVVLLCSSAGLAIHAWVSGLSAGELGIRTDNLFPSVVANVAMSASMVCPLLLSYATGLIRAPTVPTWSMFFPLYVLVFCPAQEFACRGVMFAELARFPRVPTAAVQILLTAAVYAFIHVIYRDTITLLATFAIGLVWGAIYLRWPNLFGVSLSHAVLGCASILVGLI